MANFTYDDIKNTAAEALSDLGQVAKTGLKTFCDLADAFEGAAGFGQRGYAEAIGMGELYTKMCGPGPSENPKRLPPGGPIGGQCDMVKYRVTVQVDEYYGNDEITRPVNPSVAEVWGPIDRVYPDGFGDYIDGETGARYPGFSSVKVVCRGFSTPNPGAPPQTVTLLATSSPSFVNFKNVSVVAADGFTDVCPPKPIVDYPPVGELPPVQVPGPDGPITVRPTIPPITVNPTVNFSPTVNVNLGPFNVNFNLGGIVVLIPNLSTGPVTIGPGTPNTAPVPWTPDFNLGDSIFNLNSKLDDQDDTLKKLKACVCDPYPPYDVETLFEGVQSGCYTLLPKERNEFCAINITQTPTNPKNQPGGSAPDVLYCGWAWFHTGAGQASERFPIDAFGKVFKNDGRYGVFCFTLYEGYRANVYGLHVPLDFWNSIHDTTPTT